jgi:hypothetical protein
MRPLMYGFLFLFLIGIVAAQQDVICVDTTCAVAGTVPEFGTVTGALAIIGAGVIAFFRR